MINIDTVYQKVLTIANKEQRGYITPQEFNLLAQKAQLDIYSSYFHEAKTAYLKPTKNHLGEAFDGVEMMEEKLHPFKHIDAVLSLDGGTLELPKEIYALDSIKHGTNEVTKITFREYSYTQNNPLTKATQDRMVYTRRSGGATISDKDVILIEPTQPADTIFSISYYRQPTSPNWAYVVVNEKALYNPTNSTDLQLHASEEEAVVIRVLELSALAINKSDVYQAAAVDKQRIKQDQND